MATTAAAIRSAAMSHHLREVLVKVNAGGTSPIDINAATVSNSEKAEMRAVVASTATRASINGSQLNLPEKAALLAIAGV